MKALFAIVLFLHFAVSAATLDCSIKASRTETLSEMKMTSLAQVSVKDAREAALGAVTGQGPSITKGSLQVEDGCLVYSYDIKVRERPISSRS